MATTDQATAADAPASRSLAEAVQRIGALNVFARAFPVWVRRHGTTVSMSFRADQEGGVGINLGMPPGTPPHLADELLDLLEQCQRMCDLEAIVSEMKRVGVDEAVIQNYIVEAEAIAYRMFPEAASP